MTSSESRAERGTIHVEVNGDAIALEDGATVADLLARHKLDPRRVAVEVNRQLVRRADFDQARLRAGDSIEIVTFVGGG